MEDHDYDDGLVEVVICIGLFIIVICVFFKFWARVVE